LIEKFNETRANKETSLKVKIEVAGNSLYENPNALSTENLIEEDGSAFELPLKVRLISPFLEKLGGGPCTVGNDEHPIMQYLTSEPPGFSGFVKFNESFTQVAVEGSILTAQNWPVEEAAGATGCGGEYESYVDAAINETLGLKYHRLGTTVLKGTLYTGIATDVKEEAEAGHV
jgi:hypothetical protein